MSTFDHIRKLTQALDFPVLEDDDDIRQHLGAINGRADPPPDPKPDPVAMGDNDVKNVLYINFNPEGLSTKAQADLSAKNKKLELNTNWLSLKAGVETAKQIDAGNLPDDMSVTSQMKRSTYRAKLIDYLMLQSAWLGGFKTEAIETTFSVKKAEFHTELLTTFLQGMELNPTVYGALEGVLQMLSDSVFQAKETTEKAMYYLLATVYIWDEILQEIRPTVRTFYFEANSEIKTYVAGKVSVETVNMKMGFVQNDSIFNLDVWNDGIEATVQKYLKAEGVAIINKPINIPV